jgi:hypothetical protein
MGRRAVGLPYPLPEIRVRGPEADFGTGTTSEWPVTGEERLNGHPTFFLAHNA